MVDEMNIEDTGARLRPLSPFERLEARVALLERRQVEILWMLRVAVALGVVKLIPGLGL